MNTQINQPAQQEPDYWLGFGLQAYTEKPFDGATPVWTTPQAHPQQEPTKAMIDAAERIDWSDSDVRGNIVNMWQAMCAVAPQAQAHGEDTLVQPTISAESVYEAIKHGNEAHRAWLKTALECMFAGKPIPTEQPAQQDPVLQETSWQALPAGPIKVLHLCRAALIGPVADGLARRCAIAAIDAELAQPAQHEQPIGIMSRAMIVTSAGAGYKQVGLRFTEIRDAEQVRFWALSCGAKVATADAPPQQPAQQEPVTWPHKWGCRANAFGECNMGCTTPQSQPACEREFYAELEYENPDWDVAVAVYQRRANEAPLLVHREALPKQQEPLTDELQIKVSRKLFSFHSEQDWINKAQSRYQKCGVPKDYYITIDAAGYVMHMGKCFKNAAYPVTCYELQTNWSNKATAHGTTKGGAK